MLRENSLEERSPLFVSCSNLRKQKASEEWNTTAYWGPIPIRNKHTGGPAIPFCQLPPLPCHRLSAQDRPCCASDTWVWMDKTQSKSSLKMNHQQTSARWPVLCKPCSYMMPCVTLSLGTGLAINLKCISLFWSTRGLTVLLHHQIKSGLLSRDNNCLLLLLI